MQTREQALLAATTLFCRAHERAEEAEMSPIMARALNAQAEEDAFRLVREPSTP